MTDIRDAVILVTGAAGGIGRQLAHGVAARGGRVVAWDVNAAGLEALRRELPAGRDHVMQIVDVADPAAVREGAGALRARPVRVDILVNNAGVVSGRRLLEASDEQIAATLNVNAAALFWTTRAFLPDMIARRQGHIVTVASAGGLVGVAGLVDYCASKFAAVGFTEALRMELAGTRGVHTTVACPYFVNTGMFGGAVSRWPALLPILDERVVADRILRAVERNQPRLVLPGTVRLLTIARLLPVRTFDRLITALGINAALDAFRGRGAG